MVLCFFMGGAIFYPLESITEAVLLASGTLIVSFLLYAVRVFGAGDAKLLAASALWLENSNFLLFILATSILGCFLGIFYLKWSDEIDKIRLKINIFLTKFLQDGILWTFYKRYQELPFKESRSPESKKVILPYGVAICGGCFVITYIKIWGA